MYYYSLMLIGHWDEFRGLRDLWILAVHLRTPSPQEPQVPNTWIKYYNNKWSKIKNYLLSHQCLFHLMMMKRGNLLCFVLYSCCCCLFSITMKMWWDMHDDLIYGGQLGNERVMMGTLNAPPLPKLHFGNALPFQRSTWPLPLCWLLIQNVGDINFPFSKEAKAFFFFL